MKLLHYQWDPVTNLIAEGGFAEVFKAEDLNTPGRYVALKIYKEAVSRGTIGSTGQKKYSLEQEFRKVHHLSHTHIISYYGLDYIEHTDAMGRVVSYPVLIMEYAGAGTLSDLISKGLAEGSAHKLSLEIAQALKYLHGQGIIHRDLKPGNILFSTDNRDNLVVKVTDFGISQEVFSDKTIENSFTEGIGTPHYMAPEQFYKKKYGRDGEISTATDIWAFGVLLYKMYTGKLPFGEETKEYELVREAILEGEPDFSLLPASIQPVVEKCLQKHAADRFASMQAIISLMTTPTEDQTVDLSRVVSQQEMPQAKKVAPWKYALVAVLIAALGFAGYTYYSYQKKQNLLNMAAVDYEKGNYKNAYEYYLKAADYSSGIANYYLGSMNMYGNGVTVDYKKAKKYAEKAVDQEYGMAAYLIGDLYLKGQGVAIDTARALTNFKTALPHIEELASANNSEALNTLGILYYYGYEVPKDLNKSYQNIEKAAKNNHVSAMVNLGRIYQFGQGVEINCEEAKVWYNKAIEHEDMRAYFSLGNLYYRGCGEIKEDDVKALKYFKLAAAKGSGDAMQKIGYMYHFGTAEIKVDLDEALIWYMKAAEKNNINSYNNLGYVYESKQNFKKAETWYRKAVENNSSYGAYNLGNLYMTGNLGKVDIENAKKYFEVATSRGHSGGMLQLGTILYGYKPYNYSRAHSLFKTADSLGNKLAPLYLGFMYENGNGVKVDIPLAMTYYKKSANFRIKRAEYAVGRMYYEEKVKEPTKGQAKYWFTKAADQGYLKANYKLGEIAWNANNYTEAKKHFDKIVYSKDILSKEQLGKAQRIVGYCYEKGIAGVSANVYTAVRFYRLAAENDDRIGLYNLGIYTYNGKGTTKNTKLAKTYFQRACDLNFEQACETLKTATF